MQTSAALPRLQRRVLSLPPTLCLPCSAGMQQPHNNFLRIAATPAVRSKLLMLSAPFLKRWSYVRVLEQISGGHKYLPPRQDANAPGGP
jgi:hypothetical protein